MANANMEATEDLKLPCSVCAPVSARLSTFHIHALEATPGHKGPLGLVWALQVRELVEAARQDCHFCWFITKTFFSGDCSQMMGPNIAKVDVSEEGKAKAAEHKKGVIGRALQFLRSAEDDSFKFGLTPSHTKGKSLPDLEKIEIQMYASKLDERIRRPLCGPRTEITVEVFVDDDDPAGKFITTRAENSKPSSIKGFVKAQSWLQECLHEHTDCSNLVTAPPLPRRVIDVSEKPDPVLSLHTAGGNAMYGVLTYCAQQKEGELPTWDAKSLTGTFELAGLPQTIQDGIKVARELKIRYLWIDSPTNLPSSPEEHGEDSEQLADIYKNATINVIAASADTVHDGFLADRTEHPTYTFPYVCPTGSLGNLNFRMEQRYTPQFEATNRQAELLQARLLSPRVLKYGSRTIWQCQEGQYSDGGIEDWSLDESGTGRFRLPSMVFQRQDQDPVVNTPAIRQAWYAVVLDYTQKKLANTEDKLQVIAAVAAELAEITRDVYLAGLWKSDLARQLMWTANKSTKSIRSKDYRAPSWSWASVDNAVKFALITKDSRFIATILNCQVTPISTTAPFGRVKSGSLSLRAPMKRVPWTQVQAVWEEGAPIVLSNDERTRNEEMLNWIWQRFNAPKDTADEELPESAWCVPLFQREWYLDKGAKVEGSCFSGLILEELGSGEYRRLGVFFNKHEDWMTGWDERDINVL
ncbi:hypothetical protein MMC25_006041 [Agyrium rufum]|nr:hypothetical protein [Agyrium rufum]